MTETRCVPRSLKYLLSGAFQKFADPWLRTCVGRQEPGPLLASGKRWRRAVKEGKETGRPREKAFSQGVQQGGKLLCLVISEGR